MNRTRRSPYQGLLAKLSASDLARLNHALEGLPTENLEIFVGLCKGETQTELAARLQTTQATISRTQARTIKALGGLLKCLNSPTP